MDPAPTLRGRLVAVLVGLLMLAGLAEGVCRLLGYGPWVRWSAAIEIEPGGSLFEPDPLLGYRHRPGRFRVTEGQLRFVVTHDEHSRRITHPPRRSPGALPELWLFGGSITHGWSVNDDESYAWRLQRRFPRLEVVNFGVNGYGTLHGLLQFERALSARGAPAVVVVAYASFHDERNTFSRSRRKLLVPWSHLGPMRQPAARLDGQGGFRYELVEAHYREFPLMRRIASVHVLEQAFNLLEGRLLQEHEVSEAILARFAERALVEGAAFVLAGISPDEVTRAQLESARRLGWRTVDVSVDLDDPAYNNLPWDPHPNARAHRFYADGLARFLASEVLRREMLMAAPEP